MDNIERKELKKFIKERKIGTVFEIGTCNGQTSEYISDVCKKVYTIDIDPNAGVHCFNSNIVQLFGDSRKFDYSAYSGKIDLVFIDGNHNASFIRSDSLNAFRIVKDGGFIFWHDYDLAHPCVWKTVNRFCKDMNLKPSIVLNTKLVFCRVTKKW